MLLDVRPDHRKIVQGILQRLVPDREVWAFGSRAKWLAKEYSDLDLCVLGETPLGFRTLGLLEEAFDESDLPYKVDVVDWATTNEPFRKIIKRDKVVIQEAGRGGCVAGEWMPTTLADVSSDVSYGYTESATSEKVGPHFLRITDIQNGVVDWSNVPYCPISEANHKKYRLDSGDIVVARTGNSTGENFLYRGNEDAVFASYLIRFRVDRKKTEPAFVWYNLRSENWWSFINNSKTGSAQAGANAKILGQFPIALPPLPEQKTIAHILGTLDDKIELNRRMNATLEAMARALFQSWFVDFDPVRAKLDGRQPAGLDAATSALFPDHFEHGEDAMLPVGWRLVAIENLCAINAWTLGKNDDLKVLEYVEISEVNRGNIANIATYTRGEEPSRARRRLRHGDTVLSTVRPDRGSYFLALNPPENRVASTGFAVLTPTKAPWSFIHAAMTQPEVSDYLGQMADGGAYPAVRPEIIGTMKVALPNEPKILEAFHRTCAPLFEHAEANRAQSRTLATLRDALLPKLLSGELRAKDVEHASEIA